MTRPVPPAAERRPHVVERFGERLEDPWFWLRDRKDPAVRAHLEAENAWAESVLAPANALRDSLYQEMLARIKQTDLSVPYRYRGFYYYSRTEEGKQYPIHCRKPGSVEAAENILIDLNSLAEGKQFMSLGEFDVSDDGNLLAFSTDETGFREYALQVKDLRNESLLPLRVEHSGTAAWSADGQWLFYVTEDEAKRPYRLWRHRLGGNDHEVIYEETDEAFRIGVGRTRSGEWLVMQAGSHTTSETRLLRADDPTGAWRVFIARETDREYDVDHQGDRFVMRINDTGRNFRLVTVPEDDWAPAAWRELLPHRETVMIEGLDLFPRAPRRHRA